MKSFQLLTIGASVLFLIGCGSGPDTRQTSNPNINVEGGGSATLTQLQIVDSKGSKSSSTPSVSIPINIGDKALEFAQGLVLKNLISSGQLILGKKKDTKVETSAASKVAEEMTKDIPDKEKREKAKNSLSDQLKEFIEKLTKK